MTRISCGIDFGTSNSSVATIKNGKVDLVPVEDLNVTIPSALFFSLKDPTPCYGRAAVNMYFTRQEGRFMRSLKRVLGTSLMKQGTVVNERPMKFEKIIASFLRNLKNKAEVFCGESVDEVVMGRPVHFVDNDADADRRAQEELERIARQVGFKQVAFQFEPIAAAFAHEIKVTNEKLAIVADLGGGTSDFTVIRLSGRHAEKTDRASDILANAGVRVGGNDFDKHLSLSGIMPELGYGSTYGEKSLEVPLKPYHDLAEWSKVNFLYTAKTISQTRQLLHQSHDKKRFGRLLKVLEQEAGHAILASAEDAKIALTTQTIHHAPFDFLEEGLALPLYKTSFEEAIRHEVDKISSTAVECLRRAQVSSSDIELVILTGGSTEVPLIRSEFKKLFPTAALAEENKLSSVGLGLAYDSLNKFRRH